MADLDNTKRVDDDNSMVVSMFQEMGCEEVEVKKTIRLGKKPTDSERMSAVKTRPMKVILATETQKSEALKKSKNLRREEEAVWAKVFLHQDLTVKEREARRVLVQELHQRKEMGEKDLIIVDYSHLSSCIQAV